MNDKWMVKVYPLALACTCGARVSNHAAVWGLFNIEGGGDAERAADEADVAAVHQRRVGALGMVPVQQMQLLRRTERVNNTQAHRQHTL